MIRLIRGIRGPCSSWSGFCFPAHPPRCTTRETSHLVSPLTGTLPMSDLTRREFVQSTLAAAATVTIAGTKSSGKVLGANDTIRIAVAGINGRGKNHIDSFAPMKNVQVVCLVDPDSR